MEKSKFEVRVSGFKSNIFSRWGASGVFFETFDDAKKAADDYCSPKKQGYPHWHAQVVRHVEEEVYAV